MFDATRQVAEWFKTGANGSGPLGVPLPAKAVTQQPSTGSPYSSRPPQPKQEIESIDDLPPRMVSPAAVIN